MPHKLLLADDSVTIQRVIELTFADEDVQVTAVGDGRQAIEQLQRERPDIVLADVGMPERDGYEVAAFIKGNKDLSQIPVLLLTGAFEPIDEERARSVGCDGVLVKPFEPQMVISRVKDLLSGRRPAGLWATAQPAQAALRQSIQPVADADARAGAAATPAAPGGSLEDYFDRLDAAFASLESGQGGSRNQAASGQTPGGAPSIDFTPPLPAATSFDLGGDLAGWDPDITGDPVRTDAREPTPVRAPALAPAPVPQPAHTSSMPAVSPPIAPVPIAPAVRETQPAAAPAPARMPSLAEAFAALLAAEQGQSFSPVVAVPRAVPDDVIDEIVTRVIARLGDQAVRATVVDVAERLVREEIARIKAQ
jgi:CheY-like chemotaxis protein